MSLFSNNWKTSPIISIPPAWPCPVCHGNPVMMGHVSGSIDICMFCQITGKITFQPYVLNVPTGQYMENITLAMHACPFKPQSIPGMSYFNEELKLEEIVIAFNNSFMRSSGGGWIFQHHTILKVDIVPHKFYPSYRYIMIKGFNGTVDIGVMDMAYLDHRTGEAKLIVEFAEDGNSYTIPFRVPQSLRKCPCLVEAEKEMKIIPHMKEDKDVQF